MVNLFVLKREDVFGKRIFLRADLDVPLSQQTINNKQQVTIEDDTRLKAALPTIEYLMKQNCRVIIGGHLGRPKGINKSLSLEPVARWFSIKYRVLSIKQGKREEFDGWEIGENIFLLENLRFFEGEETNDPKFAKKLASLADIYVNDAFAMCHRNHASIVGITKFLPHFAGFHLEKEISVLSKTLQNPQRPLVVLIGGKKIETKLPLVTKMYSIADYILVGGKIAQEHKEFLKIEHQKINPHAGGKKTILLVADLNEDGTGILKNSLNNFIEIIERTKTIIWNGTMGKIENNDDFGQATKKIAQAIITSRSYSVVGGGDTVEYLNKLGILDKFSFASTGGGAMLSFLSGEKLPGLVALTKT